MSRSPGVYDIPRKFSGEDKFLKIFGKRAFKTILITGGIAAMLYKLLEPFGQRIAFIGFGAGMFLMLILVPLTSFKVPTAFYLYGGGFELDIILKHIINRRRKRVIYSRCVRNGGKN